MSRGRKSTFHDPVHVHFRIERADKDAADATRISYGTIFLQGLRLHKLTRREILQRLVEDAEARIRALETEIEYLRSKAEKYRSKIPQKHEEVTEDGSPVDLQGLSE